MAEKQKTERKTEGRSHWAKGSVRMSLFFAVVMGIYDNRGWVECDWIM